MEPAYFTNGVCAGLYSLSSFCWTSCRIASLKVGVMLTGNALKFAGAFLICIGTDPFLGYALVGIGAAIRLLNGILGELTDGERLVKANGLMGLSILRQFIRLCDWWASFRLEHYLSISCLCDNVCFGCIG